MRASFVRHFTVAAYFAWGTSCAMAAGVQAIPPVMVPGMAQWTFKVNIKVDHMPSQFVAGGVRCRVLNVPPGFSGATVIATGFVDLPLAGGAASGALSVPIYLPNGRSATDAHGWLCDLYFRDGQGNKAYPYEGLGPANPKLGTPSLYYTQGSLGTP